MRKKALAHAPKLLDPNFGEAYISTAGEVGILNPYKLAPTNPTPITKNSSTHTNLCIEISMKLAAYASKCSPRSRHFKSTCAGQFDLSILLNALHSWRKI